VLSGSILKSKIRVMQFTEFGHSEVSRHVRGTGTELQYFRKCLITGPTSQPKIFKKLDTYGVSAPCVRASVSVIGF